MGQSSWLWVVSCPERSGRSERARVRTGLSQPSAGLCAIYAHHCFTPGETCSPSLGRGWDSLVLLTAAELSRGVDKQQPQVQSVSCA